MRIIRGIWAEQRLVSPGQRVRPTHEDVRDALLSYLEPVLPGCRVLDLFAGSGSLGLEALSRGAVSADFIDNSAEALHALKANVAKRKLRRPTKGGRGSEQQKSGRIFKRDAIPFVNRLAVASYDLAFADPPYGKKLADAALDALAAGDWLAHDAMLVVEEDRRAGFEAPAGFTETQRRSYGDTELVFLKFAGA